MNAYERFELQSKVISFMYKKFPHFVKRMKETYHAYDDTLDGQKIFHMEDDLWTHTLLVLQQSVMCEESDHIDILAALCHDFGKMTSGEVREEKKTIAFPLHAQKGVQATVDFLIEFQKEYELLSNEDICMIATLVAKHIEFVNTKLENMYLFCNGNIDLVVHSSRLASNDNLGRIVKYIPERIENVLENQEFNKNSVAYFDYYRKLNNECCSQIITMYCGCSNIGKDTLASKSGGRIWSLDKERVAIYLEHHPEQSSLDSKTIYSLAYQYSVSNNTDLNNRFYKSITKFINDGENLNICNTLLHSKYRIKIINYLRNIFKKNITINCVFLLSPSQRILNNAKNNSEKSIPEEVLFKFMNYQNIPTLLEGFDNIEVKLLTE